MIRFPRFPGVLALGMLPLLPLLPAADRGGDPPADRSPGRGGPIAFDATFAPGIAWSGASGAMRAVPVMPGAIVDVPIDWGVVVPPQPWYRWIPAHGRAVAGSAGDGLLGEPLPGAADAADAGAGTGAASARDAAGDVRHFEGGRRAVAPQEPGTYTLEVGWDGGARRFDEIVLLVKRPAREQRGASLHGYRIGSYPGGSGRYAPPAGFIEVTLENRHLPISRNFTLANFLTKDQFDVWPKYVLIDPLLIDKLELVLLELRAMGVPAERMHVMSGYRTPQYNAPGVGSGGRAALSRHQYGDAADVWIETLDRPGRMADLNGDGRVDIADARVILAAVDRVEAKHPHLVGGAGAYAANAAHPPFLHIDVRGQRSRW